MTASTTPRAQPPAPRSRPRLSSHARDARIWFAALLVSICFEGLGRKYLGGVPTLVFYYGKDAVLLVGLVRFGITRSQLELSRRLFGFFAVIGMAAVAWTVVQMFNPAQTSLALAVIGLRAYWLWWLAPLVIASALREDADRRAALYMLAFVSIIVAVLAAFQFASPASAAINAYARYEGEQVSDVMVVSTTGRARVSSTFSFLSGFSDYVTIIPPLLLALGLAERNRRLHWVILASAALSLGVMPMTGSRAPLLYAGICLVLIVWRAGFLKTRVGRRVLIGAVVAVMGSLWLVPAAFEGVQDRFGESDTQKRFESVLEVIPPVSIATLDYPALGWGTGTQQNARVVFRVYSPWLTETEASRLLVELGVVGYLLVWLTKLGLSVALMRAGRFLRACGQRAMAGGALAFAFMTFISPLAFDHIWQALFFVAVGLVFLSVESEGSRLRAAHATAQPADTSPPSSTRGAA